jgi:cytochrome c556
MTRPALRALASSAVAALTLLAAGSALAQQSFATPQEAIKFRQATLKEMGQNFKRVADMAAGKTPFDPEVAKSSTARAAELVKLPWAAFGPGTEGGKAKPVIWQEQDRFKAAQVRVQDEVGQLAVAAQSGNLDTIKAALGKAGAACKACHDHFRE